MLRQVTGESELRQVDQLLQVAYQSPSRERELALYPAAQPDGLFAVFDHGEPVAAAGAFAYGAFCWLGLVGTHPGYAGQGLATRLSEHILDWSREHGASAWRWMPPRAARSTSGSASSPPRGHRTRRRRRRRLASDPADRPGQAPRVPLGAGTSPACSPSTRAFRR